MPRRLPLEISDSLNRILLLALILVGIPQLSAAEKSDAETVFNSGKLWQVHITISAEELAAIEPRGIFLFGPPPKTPAKQAPVDPKREVHRNAFGVNLPWGTGSLTIGNDSYEKVGVRYKGNGTIGDTARTIKKSFKIDLDRAGGTGRFAGSKTINLHCGVTDPSKCRETLGYEIYRAAGLPAPRTAFAEVWLTVPGKKENELLGLYTIVEEIDKQFLKNRFADEKGLLMKPEGLKDFEDRGEDWAKYKQAYAPKREATKDEAARMIAFARLVHKGDDATFQKEIGSYLDLDGYLRYLAATSFVANTDSFFVLGHNYCLYLHPKTNKLHFIPWDLDRAFANFPILGSNSQQMNLSLVHPYAGPHRLTDRLLAIPDVSARYQKLLNDLASNAFAKDRLLKQLTATETALKEPLTRDAKAASERKEVAAPAMFGKPPTMKTFFEKRTQSLSAQLAGASKGFLPVGGFGAPPKMGAMLASPMMEAMDKDNDTFVSRDELLGSLKRVWDVCDKDKGGKVDLAALAKGITKSLPPPPEGAPPGGFNFGNFLANALLTRADADKDKKITSDELIDAAKAAFNEFDKMKTGKLDDEAFSDLLTAVFPVPMFGGPPGGPPKGKN